MSDANTSAAAHQDELLLVAEKLGELSDRFARIESEFTAQTAPIETSKANLDATVAALNAVLTGIKAIDSHVLSNDLGSVSKRVEQVELSAKAGDEKIAGRVTELADAVEKTVKDFHRQLAAIAAQKTELGKRVESEADAMRQQFAKVGSSIATAREELAKAIEAAKTQFATPAGLNPAGDWKAGSYERLDVVTVNGTSYVAIRATDEKPSARARDWQVLARRGTMSANTGGGISDVTGIVGMGATGLQIAQAGTPEQVREIVGVEDFEGATSSDDGTAGRVPQPLAGDEDKYLRADGTWFTPASVTAPAASQSTVDAGTEDAQFVAPLTLHGYVNPRLAARAPRARMASDGATSNRALIAQHGAHQNVAGQAVTFVIPFTVPTANPSSGSQYITHLGANSIAVGSAGTLPHSISAVFPATGSFFGAAGSLTVGAVGSDQEADRRLFNHPTFRTTYSGQKGVLAIRFPEGDSTTNPVIYWNGADITSSFALTTGGTPPNWMDANLVTTNFLSGFNWPASDDAPVAYLLNYDVGADEALRLSRGEPFRGVDLRGGSMVATYASNFSSGVDGWAQNTGNANLVATGNIDGIDGEDDVLRFENTSGGNITFQVLRSPDPTPLRDRFYEVRFRYWADADVGFGWLGWSGTATPYALQNVPVVSGAWTAGRMVVRGNAFGAFQAATSEFGGGFGVIGAGKKIYFKNVEVRVLGLLDAPILQPCNATDDATRQGMSRRMLGMSTVTEDRGAGPMPISVRRQDFTAATSVQILGGALTNKKARVVSVRGNSSANTTISLGTSTGGTQIINAQAVNGDFDISTFASRILASGASLWVTFAANTTADLKITIEDL
jgi:hypothetical protein